VLMLVIVIVLAYPTESIMSTSMSEAALQA
jgi:hypothetical protein